MVYIVVIVLLLLVIGYLYQDKEDEQQRNYNEPEINITGSIVYTEVITSNPRPTDICWNEKKQKWYIPKGKIVSNLDQTLFPPKNYQAPKAEIGMYATIWRDPVKKLSQITDLKNGTREIFVRPEYYSTETIFTLRKDGSYKEKHGSAVLFLGIEESNYVEYKQWYSKSMLSIGSIKGTDVKNYLPHNWETYFSKD